MRTKWLEHPTRDCLKRSRPIDITSVSALITSAAWTPVVFQNGWANQGTGWETAAYLKDPFGFVHLKGVITGGADDTIAFTLPAGYRPGATTVNACGDAGTESPTSTVNARIAPTGTVDIQYGTTAGAGAFIGLSGITFLAES